MRKKQERIKQYGCDGKCYSLGHTCHMVGSCPETEEREHLIEVIFSIIIIGATVLSTIIVPLGLIVTFIIRRVL